MRNFSKVHFITTSVLFLALILAACDSGESNQELPTALQLPELPSPESVFVEGSAQPPVGGPTLPPTFTVTPIPPTSTGTVTITVTPSMTITDTATPLPTATPFDTSTPSSVLLLAQTAQFQTVLPPEMQPIIPTITPTPPGTLITGLDTATPVTATLGVVQCQYPPPGGFASVFIGDIPTLLGCPVGEPPVTVSVSSASQIFERGAMAWIGEASPSILVLMNTGQFQRFNDTYDASVDPESSGLTPPDGYSEPVRGFGKVWRTSGTVQTDLGWAVNQETGSEATILDFARGRMIYIPARGDILVLIYGDAGSPLAGTWRAVPGQF